MVDQFTRSELLLGSKNMEKLRNSNILVFGIGGVGSYVCEALVRCGIENFTLVDKDTISITNVNRQIHSTLKTVGNSKVEEMKKRMLDINPNCKINAIEEFYLPGSNIINNTYDYVIDAIDTITAKIDIICKCKELNIKIISAMGAANKLDPTRFMVEDIYKTKICPLAKVMRRELKQRGIKSLKVVYSDEEPIKIDDYSICKEELEKSTKNYIPGSLSFVPSSMGLIIASEVVRDIINN